MAPSRKKQVIDLLKSLETKDSVPFAYVNPNKYIQHNLQVGPGPAGVAALIKNMPPDASVNTIRTGIYDLFRIENGRIAEHWDTLEAIPPRDQWKNSNGKF